MGELVVGSGALNCLINVKKPHSLLSTDIGPVNVIICLTCRVAYRFCDLRKPRNEEVLCTLLPEHVGVSLERAQVPSVDTGTLSESNTSDVLPVRCDEADHGKDEHDGGDDKSCVFPQSAKENRTVVEELTCACQA